MATETGREALPRSCFRMAARLRDFPPTSPGAKSDSERAHLVVDLTGETVILLGDFLTDLPFELCTIQILITCV